MQQRNLNSKEYNNTSHGYYVHYAISIMNQYHSMCAIYFG